MTSRSESSGPPASSVPRCCACSRSGRSPSPSCAPTRRRVRKGARCRSPTARSCARCSATAASTGSTSSSSTSTTRSALEWAPRAVARGARVVDNSAAFRIDADVPLVVARGQPRRRARPAQGHRVVPQLHHHGARHRAGAAAPRRGHRAAWWCPRYQSVSGAGQPGMHELDEQWTKGAGQMDRYARAATHAGAIEPGDVWDRPIAGNVIPLAGSVKDAGYTSEEWKLVRESRKILHAPEHPRHRDLRACAGLRRPRRVARTCSSRGRCSRGDAVELLRAAPGVQLVDGGDGHPTPLEAAGIDPVLVGRLREDPSQAQHPRPLGHRRQPPQGRGAQRGAARRATPRLSPGRRCAGVGDGRRAHAVHADQARHQGDEEDLPDQRLERDEDAPGARCPR